MVVKITEKKKKRFVWREHGQSNILHGQQLSCETSLPVLKTMLGELVFWSRTG